MLLSLTFKIAQKLFISEGTVKNYITNIPAGEDPDHRTALAVCYLTGKKNHCPPGRVVHGYHPCHRVPSASETGSAQNFSGPFAVQGISVKVVVNILHKIVFFKVAVRKNNR